MLSIASKYWSLPAWMGEKSSLLQRCDRHEAYQLHQGRSLVGGGAQTEQEAFSKTENMKLDG